MNELATNTKRAYGMKIWEVEHGLFASLVAFFPTSGGLGNSHSCIETYIASMIG